MAVIQPATPSTLVYTTVTISSGTSLSAAVDMAGFTLVGIFMPAAWTAAGLTFQASTAFAGTFQNLYTASGTEYSVTTDASRHVIIPYADFLGVRFLKVRSGTSGAAVNQGADRTMTLWGVR